MRIHRLEMQAFGPFADRQEIDFDELGAHGLFLLNGPTGAGKTSVLDAVCFALYGAVPGARQQARRLRSDHAAPDAAPEVVLEFSSGARRFEVMRRPQWERPAKRAGGRSTVTEQAKTLFREFANGAWTEKSSRNDEASAEITELLGMNREQFTRVVMLPQGDFAAFLRADAASREQLLQQLFGTSRFEDIEHRLRQELADATERFETAQAESEHVLRRARDEIRRYRDGLGSAPATGQNGESPEEPSPVQAAGEHPEEEIAEFEAELGSRTAAARKELAELGTERERTEKHLQELERVRARGLALQQLEREESDHARAGAGLEPVRAALQAHASAAALAGYVRAAEGAQRRTAVRMADWQQAAAEMAGHPLAAAYGISANVDGGTGRADVPAGVESRVNADLAAAGTALADEQRIAELEARRREDEADAGTLRARAQDAAARLEGLRKEESALAEEAADLALLAGGESRAAEDLVRAEELAAAVRGYAAASQRAATADRAAADARQEYQDLRQAWQDLLQARLDQAASELARTLADGTPCPVCGGLEHPSPAALAEGEDAVTREAEQEARQRAAVAEAAYEEARLQAAAAAEEAAGFRARGGAGSAEDAGEQLERAQTTLSRARSAAEALAGAERRLAAISDELEETEAVRSEALIGAAAADSRAAAAGEQAAELAGRVAGALHGFSSIGARVLALEAFAGLAAAARDAAGSVAAAEEELARSTAELEAALDGSGFDSAAEVTEALLDEETAEAYGGRVKDWEEQGRRLLLRREAQEGAAPGDAAGQPLPVPDEEDVEEAAEQAAAAKKAQDDAALLVRLLEGSALRLAEYSAELQEALERTVPLRARRDLLRSVSDTARGAGENEYKMTLSTYVLAARLEQVAAAATERLAAMTGGRYALVHSDTKSGNRKAGLGLHVTDEWTGQRRDTSTLSGGESFMASLALALGLADVVQQEAGGVNIETLFVDEGFGSLDEQSLEQVMDALEGLRDGGRVVGLVSHVAEMKQRIPAQLQILKGRNGSTVQYTAGEAVPN